MVSNRAAASRFCSGVLIAPPSVAKPESFEHPLFKTHVLDIRQGADPRRPGARAPGARRALRHGGIPGPAGSASSPVCGPSRPKRRSSSSGASAGSWSCSRAAASDALRRCVIGSSGSGKSSLIYAGLVPALQARLPGRRPRPLGRRPDDAGRQPVAAALRRAPRGALQIGLDPTHGHPRHGSSSASPGLLQAMA
mgnify:CR=1 FL=1